MKYVLYVNAGLIKGPQILEKSSNQNLQVICTSFLDSKGFL